MDRDKGIKSYFLKNNYNLVFSVMAFIALLFFIFSVSKLDLKIGVLNQVLGLFSPGMWFLLLLSLGISSVLAYYGKLKWMVIPVLIWLLIFTAQFRTANLPQLIDISTGEPTLGPDLDPYLYLRLAEEIDAGNISDEDCMRYAPVCSNNYAKSNLMPWAILGVHKVVSLFKDTNLTSSANITSVIFFLISIIGFFLFVGIIFSFKTDKAKSSLIALIASIFYAISPAVVHRTTGGIPEIESLGLAFFWFAFLFFALAWKSQNKTKWIIFGIISAIFTELMSFSWGGYRFIYIILALTTFVIFFLEKDIKKNIIIFCSWFIPSIIVEFIKVKDISGVILSLSGSGLAVMVFFLLILQIVFLKSKLKDKLKGIKLSNSIKILILTIIIGVLGLLIINPKLIITLISTGINGLLYPFGKARVSLTVAENASPYLSEAISQFGYIIWVFLFSILILFYESVKHFDKKDRIKLVSAFIIFIACLFFTRLSSSSMLNGDNFISHLVYFAGFIIFIITAISIDKKNYDNKEMFKNVDFSYILLLSFVFWAIVSMRGAIRLFFIVSPMIIITASAVPSKLYESIKKSRDDLLKLILIVLLVTSVIILLSVFIQYTSSSEYQAKVTVPGIYEKQWQSAMGWVRENTPNESIFVHWWDYGYWVQTMGKRPTVTDGGHFTAYWDHLIGRYLLTTPYPESALSFMKAHNVSYLLIDSTDIGKYSAYSSIGNNKEGGDRYSFIPTMTSNPSQIQETKNGTIRIYSGGFGLDKDIIYEEENKTTTFIPMQNSGLGGIIIEEENNKFQQPIAAYIYNGNQINLPMRYLYYNGTLYDFKNGTNSGVYIIPMLREVNSGIQLDEKGALIYLSSKTIDSLVAQLYLMNDPLDKYDDLELAHSEPDPLESYFESSSRMKLNEFFYYNGLRGPLKIWEVTPSENIIAEEGFLKLSGEFAEFDNITFVK